MFTGKERDYETRYDFFDARFYLPDVPSWLSVDPLTDKYPHISPYAYCNWNPLKFVDPDGERCELSVKGHTITISAKYYSQKKDSYYAKKSVDFWNNQSGLKYTAKDGEVFSVKFSLKAFSSENPYRDAAFTTNGNTFEIVETLGINMDGNIITGTTDVVTNSKIKVIESHKETLTGAHEVGHTLMSTDKGRDSEHSTSGIMTKYYSSKNRSASVSQETINTIVESNGFNQNSKSLWQKILSFCGIE